MYTHRHQVKKSISRSFFRAVIFTLLFIPIVASGDGSSLMGVWVAKEYYTSNTDTTFTITDPPPGLLIFTEDYYSATLVWGNTKRPLVPKGVERKDMTLDQWRSMGVPFISNAGT